MPPLPDPAPDDARRPPSPPPRLQMPPVAATTERGAARVPDRPAGRRSSSSPAPRPSQLPRLASAISSSFSPIAPSSTRDTTDSLPLTSSDAPTAERQKKKQRPRPANLAGPAPLRSQRLTAIPDTLFRENDRTPGSSGGSYYASSANGGGSGAGSGVRDERKEGARNGGEKPLFAVGGVFPKHAPRRRRSSVMKERERLQEEQRGRSRQWRAQLPAQPEGGYASSDALQTDSSAASSSVAGSGAVRPSVYERTDPFEDMRSRRLRRRDAGGKTR
ncbi:hypothetical protein JCM10213_002549 [Rhodosporidiobolus nylandii]